MNEKVNNSVIEIEQVIRPKSDKPTYYQDTRDACLKKFGIEFNLLKGIDEDFKGEVAILLENQRLANEQISSFLQFKRFSIPLVRRILGSTIIPKIASIQPLLQMSGLVYHFKNNNLVDKSLTVASKNMKCRWSYEQDLRSVNNVSVETVLAQEFTLELDRMVLTDMYNNAALVRGIDFSHISGDTIYDKYAAIQELVVDVALENKNLYRRPFANWIVTSPEMAEAICPQTQNNYGIVIYRWGSLTTEHGELTVYIDPLSPPSRILIGYRGEHRYDTGYILAPYILLGLTPTVLDPNSFMPISGILSRYAKYLTDSSYFSVLNVQNFVSIHDDEMAKKWPAPYGS